MGLLFADMNWDWSLVDLTGVTTSVRDLYDRLRLNFRWADVADIFVVSFLFYLGLHWLRRRAAGCRLCPVLPGRAVCLCPGLQHVRHPVRVSDRFNSAAGGAGGDLPAGYSPDV